MKTDNLNVTIESDFGIDIDDISVDIENSESDLDYSAAELLPSLTPVELSRDFTYPAVLLRNVYFEDVLHILKTIKRTGSFREMPLWIETDSGAENAGNIQLDSEFLLTAKYIGLGVTLFVSEKEIYDINLNNPEVIAKYV